MLLHGTAVAIGDCGVLLRGPPGSGKSSLALSLIDHPGFGLGEYILRATLVADDQVDVSLEVGRLVLAPPATLRGLLEIRGLGIVTAPFVSGVKLCLLVDLGPAHDIDRLPDPADLRDSVLGVTVPRIRLDPNGPGAQARLRAALLTLIAPTAKEA
jgi:HPr kinase/phosphorylase